MGKYDFSWIDNYQFASQRAKQQSPDEKARRKSGNAMDSIIQQQQAQQDFPSLEAQSMQGVTPPPPLNYGGFSNPFINAQNNVMDFLGRAEVQGANTRAFDMFNLPGFQNWVQTNDTVPQFIKDAFQPAQTGSQKAADLTGQIAGFALGNPADPAGLAMGLGDRAASKIAPNAPGWAQSMIKGAGGVASYEIPNQALDASFDTHNDGQQTLGQRAEDFALNTAIGGVLGLATHGLGALLERLKPKEAAAPQPTDLIPYQAPGTVTPVTEDPRIAEFMGRIHRPIPEQDRFSTTAPPLLPEGRLPIEGVPNNPQLNPGGKDFFFPRPWDEPTQTRDFTTPPEPVTPDIVQPKQLENPNKATGYLADPLQQRYDSEMQIAIDAEFNRLKQIRNKPPGYLDNGGTMRDLSPYQGGEIIGKTNNISGNPQWYRDFYKQNGRKPNNSELRQIARDHVMNGEKDTRFGDMPSNKPMKPDELEKEILKLSNQLSKEKNPANIEYLANRLDELGNQYNRLTADPHYIAPEAQVKSIPKNVEPIRYKVNDQSYQRPAKELPFSIPQANARFHTNTLEAMPRKVDPRTNVEELINGLKKKQETKVNKPSIAQEYNQKEWYHGTGTDNLTPDKLDPFLTNHEGLFGQGIYLTDNPEIAKGYARSRGKKTENNIVYKAKVNVNHVIDLEKPLTKESKEALQKTFKPLNDEYGDYDFTGLIEKAYKKGRTFEETFKDIKELIGEHSRDNGLSTNEYVDLFQELLINMKKNGIDGVTHIGGKRTGNDAHKVLILTDPNDMAKTGRKGQVTSFDKHLEGEAARTRDKIISAIDRVEQAAKERIKSRGNRLNSLPLDQLGDYAIVGAAKLAKGTVKFADWSAEMIRDFGEKVRPHIKQLFEESHKMNGTKPEYEAPKAEKKVKEPTVNQRMKAEAADTLKGLDPDTWKDKSMVGLKRETMERNFEDIMGSDAGTMKAEYIEPIKKSEAERVKFLNQQRGYVKNLYDRYKAKDKSKFDQLVQMYGEGVENSGIDLAQLKEKAPNQWKDIKDAAEKMRANYDYLIQQANKVLEENGFKPIPYRNNYFPHFESIDNFLSSIGIKIQNHSLPTDINGITHTFKPGKPFFRNALRRFGIETDYGAMEGFDRYVEGISNVIYHTENIKKLRALEDTIRNKYKGDTHLANFVSELNDYTNILSGKKALIDRAVGDGWLGRSVYNVMDNLKRRTGANIVGANLASAMTNFIPLTQAAATTGKQAFAKGMMQALGNVMKDDGFVQQSDFLIKRIGSDPLHRNLWDKTIDKSMWMMKTFDSFVSQSVVRAKYNELVDKGLSHEAALHQADSWAGKVMGARSKGEIPTILANKTLGAFTQFQLEVNNQVSFLLKDMPREYGKNKAALAAAYAQVFIFGYLFNEGYEKLIGRRPALDPIGVTIKAIQDFNNPYTEKKTAAKNLMKNVTDQIPFASVFTNGGRIPLLAGIPDVLGIFNGDKSIKDEIIKPAVYLTLPAGGSQIKKTIQGTNAMNDLRTQNSTGVYDENTKGEKYLKYPVENSVMNNIRGPLFGPSSLPETQNYYDNARRPLSVGQTKQIEHSKAPQQTYDRMMKDRRIQTLLDNIKDVQRDKKLSSTEKKDKITDIRKMLDDVKKK